jgi:hypothetical protein
MRRIRVSSHGIFCERLCIMRLLGRYVMSHLRILTGNPNVCCSQKVHGCPSLMGTLWIYLRHEVLTASLWLSVGIRRWLITYRPGRRMMQRHSQNILFITSFVYTDYQRTSSQMRFNFHGKVVARSSPSIRYRY